MYRKRPAQQVSGFLPGSLGDYVPEDHILRQVHAVLELTWLHEEVKECGNGNLTSTYGNLPSQTMVYNDSNYMTEITYGAGPTHDYVWYTYDGRRYRARLAGTYYRYLYNGVRVLEELDNNGAMQARYTTENGSYYGALLHLYRSSGTLSRFPMYDNIGTVRGLVDVSGAVTDTYELDTFGRSVSSSGTTPNPYRFGGAWGYITDPSGMLQLGVRHYWPDIARFLQQDPLRDAQNWYAYVDNSPLVADDPSGLKTFKECFREYKFQVNTICPKRKCDTAADWTLGAMAAGCLEGGITGGLAGAAALNPFTIVGGAIVGCAAHATIGFLVGSGVGNLVTGPLAQKHCEEEAELTLNNCIAGVYAEHHRHRKN